MPSWHAVLWWRNAVALPAHTVSYASSIAALAGAAWRPHKNFNDKEGGRRRETTFSSEHVVTTRVFTAMCYRGDVDILRTYFQITLRGIPVVEAVQSGQCLLYAVHRSRRCVIPVVCVNELRLDCSLTQLCQYKYIYWLILVQLHVSAFIGHLQVVLRDVDEFY